MRTVSTYINKIFQCGITKIFDPSESGLEGILKQPAKLSVTAAVQKAFLEVNEKGSEAAAATGKFGEFSYIHISFKDTK